ncbi:putative transcriptional regulator [Bacillus sp. TS-2]|nr:putative transcriptional regulator [Bacillus sp. TS-2]
MRIDLSLESLPVYEALSSKVRLAIIHFLSDKPMNVKELAEAVGLSSAIMTMHIKKLEKAGIIKTEMVPGKAGVQKLCFLVIDQIEINFPKLISQKKDYHETEVSIGHYTDFQIEPTCGIATPEIIIGEFDEPRYFLANERVDAKILWFSKGFIEYKIPNFLLYSQKAKELEITLELSSEAPFTNENWPSDISFLLNGVTLGTWTSPGDFGDSPGKYTPDWWPRVINQYGLLKCLRINEKGTYMDGIQISNITIDDIDVKAKQWTFKIAVDEQAEHVGGATVFGKGFGNYNQDIIFRLYYVKEEGPIVEEKES